MNIIQTTPKPRLAAIDDIICLTGMLGASSKAYIKKMEFLSLCKHVHIFNELSEGIDKALKFMLEKSGVSAEIQLEDIPFGRGPMKKYGSQPSRLYQYALHESNDNELILTVDPKHFADVSADYQQKTGTPLRAIGRIVNGDPQHINYIENAFPATQLNIPWEHFC
jgi:thiamine monophosphate kinase